MEHPPGPLNKGDESVKGDTEKDLILFKKDEGLFKVHLNVLQ